MILRLKAVLLLLLVVFTTVILLPFQLFALLFKLRLAARIPVLWHRTICWLIGIRVFVKDGFTTKRPLLLVANHVSWSDIIVLGSIGELSFIAKQEVGIIPGINWLSKLQRSVFVAREKRLNSGAQAQEITERLLAGDTMVLFSEGTTGCGNRLLPFNSSLLGSAQYALKHGDLDHVFIQPVSICYTALHGLPLGRKGRAIVSWEGDQKLWPHLSRFVTGSHWDVEVSFGRPIEFTPERKRRSVNAEVQACVKSMLARSIATPQSNSGAGP